MAAKQPGGGVSARDQLRRPPTLTLPLKGGGQLPANCAIVQRRYGYPQFATFFS